MSNNAADRNLLFGILALQNNFIGREQLLAAFNAWVLDKSQTLGAILHDQGALAAERRQLLDALVEEHLKQHGGDPQQSLAAVPVSSRLKEQIKSLCHPDLQASIMHLCAASAGDTTVSFDRTQQSGPRFRILRPHAKGGLGEVFVAQDEELDREVALKEIQERHAGHADNRSRFLIEAKVTGGLEHPGIVPVYGLGTYADGRPFYAMRFVKGDSLKDAIADYHRRASGSLAQPGERASEPLALRFRQLLGRFVDVCNAIAYAHSRGVLHRDLKPGNVMLGKYGETLVVDWGLAKVMGRADVETSEGVLPTSGNSGLTQAGHALGTPAFMSPEQATGKLDQLGPKSDVYSLGATLYCLLTAKPPFSAGDAGTVLGKVQRGDFPTPRQVGGKAVPAALDAVCLKAMALAPADRYATPLALAEDIEHWLADEPVSCHREPWTKRLARWRRRHNTLVTAAALVLVTVIAGGILSMGVVQRQTAQARALAQVDALQDAAPGAVPALLADLARADVAAFARTRVREHWEDPTLTDRQRLRIGLALAQDDADVRRRLLDFAQKADDPQEVLLVRDALQNHRDELAVDLWKRSREAALTRVERLRLWAILATLDQDGPGWKDAAGPVVEELFAANPLHLGAWQQAFAPAKHALLPALQKAFRDPAENRRQLATALLADYAADQEEVLSELALEADAKQFGVVFAAAVVAIEKNQSGGKAPQSKWLAELDKKLAASAAPKEIFKTEGTIAADDPQVKTADGQTVQAKVFEVELKEGIAYKIGMTSKEVDSYLVIHDSAGKELGFDDDSGGGLNSLLEFTPSKAEKYKIYAGSLPNKDVKSAGAFVLTITEAADAGPKENLASRQANAAVALLRLASGRRVFNPSGKTPGRVENPSSVLDKVWPVLKHSPDPSVRSYLVHRLGPQGVAWDVIVKRFDEEMDVSAKRALLLSLGSYDEPEAPARAADQRQSLALRAPLLPKLLELYKTDPDAGLHAAAAWLLTHWGHKEKLLAIDRELATAEIPKSVAAFSRTRVEHAKAKPETPPRILANAATPSSTWWVNSQGQTMIVIPGPVEFLMGSPPTEADRIAVNEPPHKRRIGRTFALAAKPVTVEQYLRFQKSYAYIKKYAPDANCPIASTSWHQAAAYCNWLSKEEGIAPEHWCYELNLQGQVTKMKENYLSLTGYRLPTEAEWEYACRAGAVSSRYHGETADLLGHYGWYIKNSEDRSWPVGGKQPNDFGFFDMHGNVWNWCQDRALFYPQDRSGKGIEDIEDKKDLLSINNQENRVLRGGSFGYQASSVRCANRGNLVPPTRNIINGFRAARTLPLGGFTALPPTP